MSLKSLCIFQIYSIEGKFAVLIVYVDDIILTGNERDEQENLKKKLADEFKIKALGFLKSFIGMEFA